jgi:phytoene dehydrogenase-like protein
MAAGSEDQHLLTAYDAVVIGAGHNGLTLALYLQRAGLKTLVLEQADKVGGLARTDEAPAPGFRHNPHANYLAYGAVSQVERDFDLAGAGLQTATPDAQHGLAFADGRPPLILHRNDLVDRSADSLRTYSAADADTYARVKAEVNGLDPVMADSLYSPLNSAMVVRQIEAAERIFGGKLGLRSARSVIDDLFAADEVRTLFYQLAAETGLSLEAEGSGVGFLTYTLWLVGQWRLPMGGMQAFADAVAQAAKKQGVEVATGARVERIIVRGGRAAGVMAAGHGQVIARRAIVSSAGLVQTLRGLLPDQALSARERASVEAYAAQEGPSLGSLALALTEAPQYRSGRWDPEIDRCFRTVVGYETAAATLAHLRAINAGHLPEPAAALRVNSLWDASQAPAGSHIAGGDVLMPGFGALDQQTWAAVGESYVEAFTDVWRRSAPNIGPDTVTAGAFLPPQTYDRALMLREGTAQYRTEIGQLYLCGASTHPGGGVHGACGYNAFAAIAEDLALPTTA